ncbi:GNAT family N-acetyltransferase [Erwinia pyri]|uniref:tRNA(Met) cytidine acetyltransferase TmcA n=1 Tax=Erwinia pyri TaxID=3062598 RepID=A0AA50DLH8_9GAMM|nr:GNAT family N-acetyltransferase [Erwinia sp. DE2]WLS80020.1 GNAT family N-acetyltransferase [Erwinia sp. DE2]
MADIQATLRYTERLKQQGLRQVLFVSGEAEWGQRQAQEWMAWLPGDWLWLGDAPLSPLHCAPAAAKTLLGREFLHAVFDARTGFHAEALAALAGTLKAGSWLLILVPDWQEWASLPDTDSLRWSEQPSAIASPHFITHLQRRVRQDKAIALLLQHQPFTLPSLPAYPAWQPDETSEQQALLETLLISEPGISVLIAPRGRGKSALAGLLAARWPGRCLITAPAKVATDVLAEFAGQAFEFIAPDRLLAAGPELQPESVEWLLVDEAAAIPAPLLHQLVKRFPRVLLTSTLQGYEGTGRGFMLKFCATLPQVTLLKLNRPLRWAEHDPLERFINDLLLFAEADPQPEAQPVRFTFPEQSDWLTEPEQLSAMYQLLTSAHYRTSPLDLRRMMDAPGMHFVSALQKETVQGALWQVDEGGLSAALAEAVWAGLRRPRGNLVAQSLAAHGGWPAAAQLRSRRISRIAIAPSCRRQGIGREMVLQSRAQAQGLDFLSVSFGYTDELWRFWQACGFRLVRIGSKPEASSGCYTAMALLPLSEAAEQLAQQATTRLQRDWPWLQRLTDVSLEIPAETDLALDEDDWRELAGFAWGYRPYEASIGALGRLVGLQTVPLPLLQGALLAELSAAQLSQAFGLSGRKALVAGWRQEVRRALAALNREECERWQAYMQTLHESHGKESER